MKAEYNREEDVLMLHLCDDPVDHAEETEGIILHVSREDRPVLLEVLDASDFLSRLSRLTARCPSRTPVPL